MTNEQLKIFADMFKDLGLTQLKVNDKDFERFYNAIKNFINEMPKHLQHKYRWEN